MLWHDFLSPFVSLTHTQKGKKKKKNQKDPYDSLLTSFNALSTYQCFKNKLTSYQHSMIHFNYASKHFIEHNPP